MEQGYRDGFTTRHRQEVLDDSSLVKQLELRLAMITFGLLAIFSTHSLIEITGYARWSATTGKVTSKGHSGIGAMRTPTIGYSYSLGDRNYEAELRGSNIYWSATNMETYRGDRFEIVKRGPEVMPAVEAEKYFDKFELGGPIAVYYDPDDPARSVIEVGLTPISVRLVLAAITITSIFAFASAAFRLRRD